MLSWKDKYIKRRNKTDEQVVDEIFSLPQTCALDVCDREYSGYEISKFLGISNQGAQYILNSAIKKFQERWKKMVDEDE